jgi:hypothetical protein
MAQGYPCDLMEKEREYGFAIHGRMDSCIGQLSMNSLLKWLTASETTDL